LKKFPRSYPFSLAVIAAIGLLLAQLGALNHAYSHVPQAAASVQGTDPAAHTICDDCLSFAPVLFAAGTPTVPSLIGPPARAIAVRAVEASQLNNRLNLAFRSRAPPVAA